MISIACHNWSLGATGPSTRSERKRTDANRSEAKWLHQVCPVLPGAQLPHHQAMRILHARAPSRSHSCTTLTKPGQALPGALHISACGIACHDTLCDTCLRATCANQSSSKRSSALPRRRRQASARHAVWYHTTRVRRAQPSNICFWGAARLARTCQPELVKQGASIPDRV